MIQQFSTAGFAFLLLTYKADYRLATPFFLPLSCPAGRQAAFAIHYKHKTQCYS